MTKNRIYPGMLDDNSVEIFVIDDQLKAIQNGKIISFTDFSFPLIQIIEEAMNADEKAVEALMQMHPGSNLRRIEQFAKCRFGGLDFTPDIKNGVIGEGDYWDCPLRNTCAHNGVLCKAPKINGQAITPEELQIIRFSATSTTNEVMAEELNLPFGTLHKMKQVLYEKCGVQTKQEMTVKALKLNLI